jgi:hypothetical protein
MFILKKTLFENLNWQQKRRLKRIAECALAIVFVIGFLIFLAWFMS